MALALCSGCRAMDRDPDCTLTCHADVLVIPAWWHRAATEAGRCQARAPLLVAVCATGQAAPPQLFSFPHLSPHGSHEG